MQRITGAQCAALFVLAGCVYERAPRNGPLAAAADSLLPPAQTLICRQIPAGLPDAPASRICATDSTLYPAQSLEITRSGYVLAIVLNWADDSAGQQKAADVARMFTKTSGVAPKAGLAVFDGDEVTHWRTAAVCYGLFRHTVPAGSGVRRAYQASWYAWDSSKPCG
jgi:hypothetical protein